MESGTKGAKGPRGPLGHVGVIPVERNNRRSLINFIIERTEDLILESIPSGNDEYLLTNIRYCFEDIHRAALQYLGIGEDDWEQEEEEEEPYEEA